MDIKQVQNDLRTQIVRHQAVRAQLKRDPKNIELSNKLKIIQQLIGSLGKKQNTILKSKKSEVKNESPPKQENRLSANNSSTSQQQTAPLNLTSKKAPTSGHTATSTKDVSSSAEPGIGRSNILTAGTALNNILSNAIMTCSATNLNPNRPNSSYNIKNNSKKILPKTLLHGTLAPSTGKNSFKSENNGPITSENSVILLAQTNTTPKINGKQLFRILPKDPEVSTKNIVVSLPNKVVPTTSVILQGRGVSVNSSVLQNNNQVITLITTSTGTIQQPNKKDQESSSGNTSSLGVWHKLHENKRPNILQKSAVTSSKNPTSYQKFRICDGKPVPIPSVSQSARSFLSSQHEKFHGKPRNDALKEVLAQAKSVLPEKSQISISQQVPKKQKIEGFIPITNMSNFTHSIVPKPILKSSFVPGSHKKSTSPFYAIDSSKEQEIIQIDSDKSDDAGIDHEKNKKLQVEYLRNLELVPHSVGKNMLNRRFSKRRVAANPVYSGGIYVAHNNLKRSPSSFIDSNDLEIPTRKTRNRQRTRQAENENISRTSSNKSATNSPIQPQKSSPVADGHKLIIDEKILGSSNLQKQIKKRKRRRKNSDKTDGHDDQCNVCNEAGEVLMCDTCSLVYHLKCCSPPLQSVPQGMWVCSKCIKQFSSTKCSTSWTSISNMVHSYHVHYRVTEEERAKLSTEATLTKAVHTSLQNETKILTEKVKAKLCARSKVQREGRHNEEKLRELSNIVRFLNKRAKFQDGNIAGCSKT